MVKILSDEEIKGMRLACKVSLQAGIKITIIYHSGVNLTHQVLITRVKVTGQILLIVLLLASSSNLPRMFRYATYVHT